MKSGRVTDVSAAGDAGVVRDADGEEYPFVAEAGGITPLPGQVVLFDVSDRVVGKDAAGKQVKAKFAKVLDA
jgi:hypothetical protein